jgi:predicted nucleic acid-binding protein
MTGLAFVDTNLLVYARDASEPKKQEMAAAWLDRLWRTRSGRLSAQVLQEFYVTVTRKLDPGMDAEEARRDVRSLMAWRPLPSSGALLESAWSLEDRHKLSFWDALIVAAAQDCGCAYLLTEDLHPGQRLDAVMVVDPFAATFDDVA